MANGRDNKLTGHIAEHLVCAELGRRGILATPFSGNVPTFDLLAADENCRAVPIQVKATTSNNWRTDASRWMDLRVDRKSQRQIYGGPTVLDAAEMIYVMVALGARETGATPDRFFVLTRRELQAAYVTSYTAFMERQQWLRPRSPKSFDCRVSIGDLSCYEDRWSLVLEQMSAAPKDLRSEQGVAPQLTGARRRWSGVSRS
jgi:hypothetical protein